MSELAPVLPDPLSLGLDEFSKILQTGFQHVVDESRDLAVGVSGGPDSMALVRLLSDWVTQNEGPQIHALIVDHGLRPESAMEAERACSALKGWPKIKPEILSWDGHKPESAIQEEARKARYALMSGYCAAHGIDYLFLAHHLDDQAETVLFRLAKGSGLDGLSGMKPLQVMDNLTFVRPLLGVSKERLVATCEVYGLDTISDPSNDSQDFARVRLRQSMDVLGREGLTPKRLAMTAARLERARASLNKITKKAWDDILVNKKPDRIVLNFYIMKSWPEEIALRVVLSAIEQLRPDEDYAPRMEKIESLFYDLWADVPFRKRTLGRLIFSRDDKNMQVIVQNEESEN